MNKQIRVWIERNKSIKNNGKENKYYLVKDLPNEVWEKYDSYGNAEYYKSNLDRYKSHTIIERKFTIVHKERLTKYPFRRPKYHGWYDDPYDDSLYMIDRLTDLMSGNVDPMFEGEESFLLERLYPSEFKD